MTEGELGRAYADGEIIFEEGDKANVMYVIRSGAVNIVKKSPSGSMTIATLGSGEVFGEMALFDRLPRSATAVASGDARILTIDRKKLFSTIDRDPTLVFKILESMGRRIRVLNSSIMKLTKDRSDMMDSCIDLLETCSLILEKAQNSITSEHGSVMLLDHESQRLLIKAAFGSEHSPKMNFSIGEGIAGDVLKTGKAEIVNDVSRDSRFVPGPMPVRSMLCAPLRHGKNTFGLMVLSNSTYRPFAVEDLSQLNLLSIYAAIAIENAKSCSLLKNTMADLIKNAVLTAAY